MGARGRHQFQNFALERQGILTLGKHLDTHSCGAHQVLEEIVLHVIVRQVLLQPLVHGIVVQGAQLKNGKGGVGVVAAPKVGNFGVGIQFLMKVIGGKGQYLKASRLQLPV